MITGGLWRIGRRIDKPGGRRPAGDAPSPRSLVAAADGKTAIAAVDGSMLKRRSAIGDDENDVFAIAR